MTKKEEIDFSPRGRIVMYGGLSDGKKMLHLSSADFPYGREIYTIMGKG
jgi:hypothetical protein